MAMAESAKQCHGKAIVFARRDVVVGDLETQFAPTDIADIPDPGTRVRQGRPICTIFAVGRDRDTCRDALVAVAQRVYASVEQEPQMNADRRGSMQIDAEF